VAEYLISLNLEVKTGVAKTGVVGFLLCNEAGKTVALRADIDALPMQEKNDVPYASINPGVMQACGKDHEASMCYP
jgi:metal-dependent amidase/aminoacylase/carboxypeptidase family protein